jgi:acetyltransferase-like isoleucine patch superfamily enzyme
MIDGSLPHDWFDRALPANVQIGQRSWLYSSFSLVHCCSRRAVALRIGDDSGLYNGTFFDLGPEGEVDIGNYCTIVGAIFATNGRVEIGDYSFIAHEVVIADHISAVPAVPGSRSSQPPPATTKRIGENVWIGARAVLTGNIQIGDGAIIGAAAVLNSDVPPYSIFGGNPAIQIGVVQHRHARNSSRPRS